MKPARLLASLTLFVALSPLYAQFAPNNNRTSDWNQRFTEFMYVYCRQYANFDELSQHLEEFINGYYNRQRLHSALGYRTPEEFEREAATTPTADPHHQAAAMPFFSPPAIAKADPEIPAKLTSDKKWRPVESRP